MKSKFTFVIAVLTAFIFIFTACPPDDDDNDGITPVTVKMVSVGQYYTVAIKTDGSLWAWGRNDYGQLGDGTTVSEYSPKRIGTENDWASVAANFEHTVAIKADGSLWAWGRNNYGQLGVGDTTNRNTPVRVGEENNWAFVSAGDWQGMAIKTDGTLWAWGRNAGSFILGDGSGVQQNSPVQIGEDNDWAYIDLGGGHAIALKKEGSLWVWGENSIGQLGSGESGSTIYTTPTQLGEAKDWAIISTVFAHNATIKKDGSLWAWGNNYNGQVGNGDKIDQYSPVKIGSATDWASISTGSTHTVALKNDGSIWIWGNKGYLGDGSAEDRNVPAQMGAAKDWSAIAAGRTYTMAIKKNGSLWAWGSNTYGGLGTGNTTAASTPVQITLVESE